MASTGKTLPGTCANVDNGSGGPAWTDVDNAKLADGVNATITFTVEANSQYLVATSFDFGIPATATINGVRCSVLGDDDFIFDGEPLAQSLSCFLYSGGTIIGTERNPTLFGSESTAGSSSDKWNATLTPTIVNSSGFGVAIAISVGEYETFGDARLDYVKLDIIYTLASSGKAVRMLLGVG